ncbi:toxin CSTX-20 [Parasteatoda tepidariorum]|uniref:Prokineticin domain-containing protein n=1 Tax=Parasteatoda tepidariorum TaxID=114398 RepID=A0A2L2Y070_PARTP|nr:toxin CSTX-20 [Parasteatoda tepidariorum]
MNWFVLTLFFAYATVSLGVRRCKSAEDCEEDECCVKYTVAAFLGGVCRELREEGKTCTPIIKKDQEEDPNMYLFQCPCKAGLECVGSIEKTIFGHVVKHKPKCVVPEKEDLSTVKPPERETTEPEPEPEPETAEPEPEPNE